MENNRAQPRGNSLLIQLKKLAALLRFPQAASTDLQVSPLPASNIPRITSLSDCVVAVALTLILVNIKLPPARLSETGIQQYLLHIMLPQVGIYLFSYIVVASSWISHAQLFYYIRRSSNLLISFNLLFLATIVFLPVPIALFFVYGNQQEAWIFFASTQVVTGLLLLILWVYARREYFLDPAVPESYFVSTAARLSFITLGFLGSAAVAFFNLLIAQAGFVVVYVSARLVFALLRPTVMQAPAQNNRRLYSITDNMTAVAVTFLIVTVAAQVPLRGSQPISQAIHNILSELWLYALSFMIVGLYWLSHHRLFQFIRYHTLPFLWLNFSFLFLIELEPRVNDLRAEYPSSFTTGVLYALWQTLLGVTLVGIWWYAMSRDRLVEPAIKTSGLAKRILLRACLPPLLFVSSVGLLYVHASYVVYVWLLALVAELAFQVWQR
jgi:uncharacterized membrane protein